MNTFGTTLHRTLGIWSLGTTTLIFRESALVSDRIHPYTALGWRVEQAEVGLGLLIPTLCLFASMCQRSVGSKVWSALFLGCVSFLLYRRYFTVNLEFLAIASFFDAGFQASLLRGVSILCYLRFLGLTLATVGLWCFLVAGRVFIGT